MNSLLTDFRQALRRLVRSPGFTAAATSMLALGIGATTAVFSVINGVLLRPLPYEDPGQLLRIYQTSPEQGVERGAVSLVDFEDWREQGTAFATLAAFDNIGITANLTGEGEPAALRASYVSGDFFAALGTSPLVGRVLSREEVADGELAVVLSDALWQRQFGGDPAVVGSSVNLDGTPYAVVGVMPPAFRYPSAETDLWLPVSLITEAMIPRERNARWLGVIGRLAPGATIEHARTEMSAIASRLAEAYPATNEAWNRANVVPLQDTIVGGEVRQRLLMALAAVAFVLLMVCANLANLLLARGTVRGREMALRAALGAGRVRLSRQLFAESLALALLGGGLGVLLAACGMRTVRALTGSILPRVDSVGMDLRVLGFALVVSLLTGLIFGMVPALRAARPRLQEALKEGGRALAGERNRLRAGLVVSQVALAVVLTISAGLMLKNFQQLRGLDPGFNPDGVLVASMELAVSPAVREAGQVQASIVNRRAAMIERLRALPGVEAVGTVNWLSFPGDGEYLPLSRAGGPSGETELAASGRLVNRDYFRAMGIPILAGSVFTDRESLGTPMTAVVSEAAAARLWPAEDPIGQTVRLGDDEIRVIGLAADVRYGGLLEEPPATVYLPQDQHPRVSLTLAIRTQGNPLQLATPVREAIWEVDGDQPIRSIGTLSGVVAESIAQDRLLTLLLGAFGASALLLAALGLYGVLSYIVSQQTREIGVRMALGAGRGAVLRLVIGRGMLLVVTGVVVGLAAALGTTRVLEGTVQLVSTLDPLTHGAVTLVLMLTALLAAYLPARRATRIDPMVALRAE